MVYLLETSKSSWDAYEHIVIGVANDPFEADKLKQEWLVKLKEKQLQYSKEQQEQYNKELENYNMDIYTPDYLNKYLKWYYTEYNEYSDKVKITEIKENTIICNNLQD